jgi:hypothetical protein
VNFTIHVLDLTFGHPDTVISAIEGMNLKESITCVRITMGRVVVELFPKSRFGRAEMFFDTRLSAAEKCSSIPIFLPPKNPSTGDFLVPRD